MAEIIIRTSLDNSEIARAGRELVNKINESFNAGAPKAKEAGRKIGNALDAGIKEGLRGESQLQRLQAIHAQSATRIQEIEARKEAQLELIRARAAQRAVEHQQKIQRETQRTANALDVVRAGVGKLSGAFALLGGAVAFKQIAQFGVDLDKARNTLTALTGSVDAANKKMAELRELARSSPGVTQGFANDLFIQFKALREISDTTINKLIQSIGKLNTVFSLPDIKTFSRNLIQIFKGGFELDQVKEAINQLPIFNQLLESAFGTSDNQKLKKLRDAGKLSLQTFLDGFIGAVNNDPRFKEVTESLGGKLQKSLDETKLKLGELGERILRDILPILDKLLPVLNSILSVVERLPVGLQAATISLLAVAPAINTVAGAIGGLKGAMVSLGAFLATPAGLAALALLGVGTAAFALQDLIKNQIPRNVSNALNLPGDRSLLNPDPNAPTTIDSPRNRAVNLNAVRKSVGLAPLPGAASNATASAIKAAGKAAKDRFIPDFGQGDAELLRHDAELARIRESNAAVARRREDAALAAELAAQRPAQLAGFNAANLERIRQIELETLRLEENTAKEAQEAAEAARKALEKIEPVLSDSERFMRGFTRSVDAAGNAFENFGANVAQAFGNVRELFSGLKQAVFSFFNDLIGGTLQNLVRQTLGGLFGGRGGGGFSLGNLFRTPSFAGGGGIMTPPSVSLGPFGFGNGFGLGGLFGGGGSGGARRAAGGIDDVLGGAGSVFSGSAASRFSLAGLGRSFAAVAPFIGGSLGAGLGGISTAGNILGGLGGALGGLVLGASTGAIGGGLGSAFALSGALGPAALVAAPLLLAGGVLLGKAKQRRSDEEASGQLLTQALTAIDQLATGISTDQIEGAQARAIFDTEILGAFRQQISTLKTKSVVQSRLTNQVRDLENVYQSRIPPLILEQQRRRTTSSANALAFSRQIPEFATGGISGGGLALLHNREMVLTQQHQRDIRAIAGSDVFNRVGVPGIQRDARFDNGGVFAGGGISQPIEINLEAQVVIGKGDATRIVIVGGNTPQGRAVTVNNVNIARTNREL